MAASPWAGVVPVAQLAGWFGLLGFGWQVKQLGATLLGVAEGVVVEPWQVTQEAGFCR